MEAPVLPACLPEACMHVRAAQATSSLIAALHIFLASHFINKEQP